MSGEATETYLYSGYARLPRDVSHQPTHGRVGVVVVVDGDGRVLHADTTLLMGVAREFFVGLLYGHDVVGGRDEIEAAVRHRYRGHSQGALLSALQKVYDAVDQAPPGA